MPETIVIEPEEITLMDFSGGFQPDPAKQAVPRNALLDVNNLLPDRETGTLETRKGIARFSDLLSANPALANFEVRTVVPFNRNAGDTNELGQQYLVVVVRKRPKPNPREADDVRLYAINVQTGASVRIDHATRIWRHYAAAHWGETIDNFYYGGSELDPMYSYKPFFKDGTVNPNPYEPDASMGQWCSNQWAVDTVYAVGDRVWDTVTVEKVGGGTKTVKHVFICTKAHTAKAWNRPGRESTRESKKWENQGKYITLWANGTAYKIGDTVSYEVTDVSKADKFPRYYSTQNKKSTFICTRDHTAATGVNEPPGDPWEPYRAPVSNVAKFHGERLFIRDSDAGTGRLRYSDWVTADGYWDPTAWESTDVQGAGFLDVRSGDGDDIRALESLNQYLIICKRRGTWALAGYNPSTWTMRQISDVGCLHKRAICSHEGLVYFFSDQGFFMTDGVVVQEVPNGNVIRDWIHDNLDLEENNIYKISMGSYRGFIWISLPAGDSVVRPNITLVYDPATSSFWKLDIGTWQYAVNRVGRIDEMFFAKVGAPALVMRYDPDTNKFQDDTGASVQAFQEIPWFARLSWLTFGPWKEQRRIRRLWTRIRTAAGNSITVKYFRDYVETAFKTITRTTTVEPVSTVEGDSVRDKDPHAFSIEVSGTKADASLISAHISTQYRRRRSNRGVRA